MKEIAQLQGEIIAKEFLFVRLLFYVPLKNFSHIRGRHSHHCRWRAAKFRPILPYVRRSGPLSREGSLSCHTCCNTGPQFFSGLIRRIKFSRLLRHTRGCGGSILTRILTGLAKELKYTENFFKIFSRTSTPNSIKLGTNYPWVKEIQV
jgi:hypothetical protein